MKQLISIILTGIAALGLDSPQSLAQVGINLSLQPSPQTINVGDSASMDLVVSGLGNLSSPSLGAFDLELSYDPAIISTASLTFGNFLDLGNLRSSKFSDLTTAGVIHLDEVSFESSSDLNNAQPDTFTLATLGFKGLAAGISSIDFTLASLSDELGQSLTAFSTTGGSIEVESSTVPDAGSTAFLLLVALVSLSACRWIPVSAPYSSQV